LYELAGTDNLPPITVTRDMVLVDGFHRLEAAKRRGDEKIRVTVQDVTEDEAMALAAKLNISHGKRLTVLELARRMQLLIKKRGWSQGKAAKYFQKTRVWVTHYINIAKNLDTKLVTRVTTLDYGSARELAKLPQNRQGEAYRMARKMAAHDRKQAPTVKLVAKAVKKIQEDTRANGDKVLDFDREKRWLMLSTLWNINVSDERFGFNFPGRIPGQVVLNILYYYAERNDLGGSFRRERHHSGCVHVFGKEMPHLRHRAGTEGHCQARYLHRVSQGGTGLRSDPPRSTLLETEARQIPKREGFLLRGRPRWFQPQDGKAHPRLLQDRGGTGDVHAIVLFLFPGCI
jgi:ParB-like chromosome segregation protein Spo0J